MAIRIVTPKWTTVGVLQTPSPVRDLGGCPPTIKVRVAAAVPTMT